MSVIIQQPDPISFCGNLKPFLVTATVAVSFQLHCGPKEILNEKYTQGEDNVATIDIKEICGHFLSISLPSDNEPVYEQVNGIAEFTATIDANAPVVFTVIKGGVRDLTGTATDFATSHWLTWQDQQISILQTQPQWLSLYTTATAIIKLTAYFLDSTTETITLCTLEAHKLAALDMCWVAVNAALAKKDPVVWDTWFEDEAGTRLSYIQRYCLRNASASENIFIWGNTLGGIDSFSFTGKSENNRKLEHKIAQHHDGDYEEYDTEKKAEHKQNTGYLTLRESIWLEDFFYSNKRFKVDADGTVRAIALLDSTVETSDVDDIYSYDFTFRWASENKFLNLDRAYEPLQAPEGPSDFFLTELLGNLPAAQITGDLLFAVQAPGGQGGWMKISLAQLLAAIGSNIQPVADILDGGNIGTNTAQLDGGNATIANTSTINGGNA